MRWDDLGLIWRRRRRGCICFKVSRLQRNRLLFDLGGVLFAPLQSFAHPFAHVDRKSTRLNSSHDQISYAVFCLKKKKLMAKRCEHYFVAAKLSSSFYCS